MTLRELLQSVDRSTVYKVINNKDNDCRRKSERRVPLSTTVRSYSHVIDELLSKPKTKTYKMSWLADEFVDSYDNMKYVDICFLNGQYVSPKIGLKPYGCKRGKNPPKGYYNCNLDKYSKTFAVGFAPWSKVIDTPVVNLTNYPNERIAAEILWEITFYGWTENIVTKQISEIRGQIQESIKAIDKGDCVTIRPKKDGDMSIVIPTKVLADITKTLTKKKKK